MSIRKTVTSKGLVRYQVYVNDATARRRVYIGTFERQRDAEEAQYEAKRRLRLGEPLKPKPAREEVRFDQLAKRWYAGLVGLRPSTKRDYDKAIRRLQPYLGGKHVSQITRRDIDELIADLSQRYAPSTVRKTVVILKMVLRMAVDHDYLDKLPLGSTKLALPKSRRRVFEPLTREQAARLMRHAPEYWQPFVQFMLTSGLRRAEAWGLTVDDLDLDLGVVHVRRQLVKRRFVELKTDAAYRDVPLPKQTIDVLKEHLSRLPDSDLRLLFPTPDGRPVDPPNFYARVWIPTRQAAGLPSFRLHDCRHHVASIYLSQGRSITYVQRLLGHSNPITLLSIYSWVTKGEAEVATTDFESWLGEEGAARYLSRRVAIACSDRRDKPCSTNGRRLLARGGSCGRARPLPSGRRLNPNPR